MGPFFQGLISFMNYPELSL